MHVEGEVEVVTSTEGLTGRQAKAKGWYDVRTGRVTIVLPNNKNAADVRETVLFAYGKTIACEQTQTPNVTIKRPH